MYGFCATCRGALGESRGVVILDHGARLHNSCFALFATWYETRRNLIYLLRMWRRRAIYSSRRDRLACDICSKRGCIFATGLLRLQTIEIETTDARFSKTYCATCLVSSVAVAKRYLQVWRLLTREALLCNVWDVWRREALSLSLRVWKDYVRDVCSICLERVGGRRESKLCERLACGHNYHSDCWTMYAASVFSHDPPAPLTCAVCRARQPGPGSLRRRRHGSRRS